MTTQVCKGEKSSIQVESGKYEAQMRKFPVCSSQYVHQGEDQSALSKHHAAPGIRQRSLAPASAPGCKIKGKQLCRFLAFLAFPLHLLPIASSILVSIFLVPSLALMNTSDSHPMDGSVGTQIIHVDALLGIVSIQDNNVLSEWNGIVDYKSDLLAAKLFGKMACVLAKMDLAVFPSLDEITQALGKQASGHYPPSRGLTYTVIPSRVKNLAQYGMPVKDLCRAVPTYFAQQQKEGTALAMDPDFCSELQILSFMGLSICGEILGL
ncbi:gastrokine-3-like [Phodopus roborovskii]|uniref:gastrokine-3-like n=1 Tax=Phodopus roborovskii TaxID=109678 RepID=UPI0021E39579|nr:gastrokine-3-like [Phodopus roborovskii]